MHLVQNNKSPYGPIRDYGTMGYQYARRCAQAGGISRDGMIGQGLHERVQQDLVAPTIRAANEAVKTGEMPEEALGEFITKVMQQYYWVPLFGQYELAGRQIFDLHDRLSEMLLQTDTGESTLEDLHLPYEAFYLRFGAQDTIKVPFDIDGRFEFFDGAYIATAPCASGELRIKIGFSTVHEDGSAVGYPGYFFDILPDERKLPVSQAIDTAMRRKAEQFAEKPTDDLTSRNLKAFQRQYDEEAGEMLRAAASLLVNSLFYLESLGGVFPAVEPGRDTPPGRHAKWLQSKPEQRNKQRVALTSDGYALVRLVGREIEQDLRTATAQHATVRVHWRRGHWRQQRHGEHLVFVKRIWIKPVLVGKDAVHPGDEIPGHLYVAPPHDRAH